MYANYLFQITYFIVYKVLDESELLANVYIFINHNRQLAVSIIHHESSLCFQNDNIGHCLDLEERDYQPIRLQGKYLSIQ